MKEEKIPSIMLIILGLLSLLSAFLSYKHGAVQEKMFDELACSKGVTKYCNQSN